MNYARYTHNFICLIADKYCIEFVTHCQKVLPNSTRSVQIAILTALNLFVDRLVVLKINKAEMSVKDKKLLDEINDNLNKILLYCISKYNINHKYNLYIIISTLCGLKSTYFRNQFSVASAYWIFFLIPK